MQVIKIPLFFFFFLLLHIFKRDNWHFSWLDKNIIVGFHGQNYRTISLISHPSQVMLKIIQNKLKPRAEKIIAEEQAGFRAGRSTTEHIFILRILCEKYLQHQQDHHVFRDFKRQGLACSFVGNHEEVQYQHKPYPGHQKRLWQGH